MRVWVDRLAEGLIQHGLADRPVMILSGNSRLHLALALAAMTIGTPVAPVSTAYSLHDADHVRLRAMVDLVDPGLVLAEDVAFTRATTAITGPGTTRTVLSSTGAIPGAVTAEALARAPSSLVDRRCAELREETLAKILFTSGSTGAPKGVLNTHGMLAANQRQIRAGWPFLADEPPILLDWLPWSHTFGGNHNTNMVLCNGGTIFLDDGRPAADLIGRTAANLADVRPTIYLNVPAGYAMLLPRLDADPDLARTFFGRLRLSLVAAAAPPQRLWDDVSALADRHGADMHMTASWGMTETSPAAITTHFPTSRSDCLGVPLPGVEILLVPTAGDTYEMRLKGPNVTPGYHGRPDLGADAFDEAGYLRTGDAVALTDPDDPGAGLVFRGRLAEGFKLSTGTFVTVGTLRPRLLSAAGGVLSDAVLCGENDDIVGALVWLHPDHAHRHRAGVPDESLRDELRAALDRLAAGGAGASQRVERVLVLTEPPGLGEINDKGYINQRAVRDRRADLVRTLCSERPASHVVCR